MNGSRLNLSLLPDMLAVCRLAPEVPLPAWALHGSFCSITRTPDELSIVCVQDDVPLEVRNERDWRCLVVAGPLDFALTGILAAIAAPLAQAGISIFAVSTFDTDYVLVKEHQLAAAIQALSEAGHQIQQ